MIYGSVCSGIEAATVAWHPLGWRAAFFSEIEAFPRAVLRERWPGVPCHGDFTTIEAGQYEPIELLVGGTPCQDFSVAGLRKGLDGERGHLTIEFLALAGRLRPRWLVWENVPGVLSIDGGRAFGIFLGRLGQLGYGFAYRVLDAQHFGVPQRRRRVFVVGYLGDWRRAAAVLFERESLSGHPAPSREAGEGVAPTIAARTKGGGGLGTDFDCDGGLIALQEVTGRVSKNQNGPGIGIGGDVMYTLQGTHQHGIAHSVSTKWRACPESDQDNVVVHSLRADGFDASEDGTGRGTPITLAIRGRGDSHDLEWRRDGTANAILTPNGGRAGIGVGAVAFSCKDHGGDAGDIAPTLRAGGHAGSHANAGVMPAVAFTDNGAKARSIGYAVEQSPTLGAETGTNSRAAKIALGMAVRRLTPRECERLQGFPDDYTLIPYRGKPAADGPRYKALGNSMAVPCMRWIGERIAIVDEIAEAA